MRVVMVAALCVSTSCAAFLADSPGPRCEETSAVSVDNVAGSLSALAGLVTWGAIALCVRSEGCTPRTGIFVFAGTFTVAAGLYFTSAVIGARKNEACRRARAGQRITSATPALADSAR